jgi:hypothetical protein
MRIMTAVVSLSTLINKGFEYVINTSKIYNIDESHALKHSMEVFNFINRIYDSEVVNNPYLEEQLEIILLAGIGHDMCDKKYMNEQEGIEEYLNYLSKYVPPNKLEIIGKIIGTMSYSKVKINGYPDLGEYQLAYHIVREADLLSAYDIDRCIIYAMYHDNCDYDQALKIACELFEYRVFNMKKDKLFKTDFSKRESLKLHIKAKKDVENLKLIL